MTDTVTTRIRLPGTVHREVKAEAARHGIKLDDALGMCVAFVVDMTTPLCWRSGTDVVVADVKHWLKRNPVKG
jgi:hypothetical protein